MIDFLQVKDYNDFKRRTGLTGQQAISTLLDELHQLENQQTK